jgi:predicted enzyme related to lactoylglutathione lyase
MKRLHVHLHVHDIANSVRFYSTLFGQEPARRETDYAKWMLDDPRVNFAISARGGEPGLGHLGIQVESAVELASAAARAERAAGEILVEDNAHCCYATGDKAWATDPQGVRWETFHTTGDLTVYGEGAPKAASAASGLSTVACCGGACG